MEIYGVYFGQTQRSIKERYSEHERAIIRIGQTETSVIKKEFYFLRYCGSSL